MRVRTRKIYFGKMDPEVLPLCDALNEIRGIRTTESCCGHGKDRFRIFFKAETMPALAEVAYYAMLCHSGVRGWRVVVHTDCSMKPGAFMLEGPVGDYQGADTIAKVIHESRPWVKDEHRTDPERSENRKKFMAFKKFIMNSEVEK